MALASYNYTLIGGTAYEITCNNKAEAIEAIIPSSYNGLPVTSIGSYAFENCSSLTSVTVPDSVTSIGYSAFYGCSGLTSVTIGNGVTSIGNDAFLGCDSLTSVTIPNSATSIGDYAFQSCSSLTSVTIGNGVTSIGSSAFYGCTSLASVILSQSLTTIGENAFWGCSSLTSITLLSNTPPTIVSNSFSNMSSSAKIYLTSSSLSAYQSATNWSSYASKMETDDLRIAFILNANANKRFTQSKILEAKTELQEEIDDINKVIPNDASSSNKLIAESNVSTEATNNSIAKRNASGKLLAHSSSNDSSLSGTDEGLEVVNKNFLNNYAKYTYRNSVTLTEAVSIWESDTFTDYYDTVLIYVAGGSALGSQTWEPKITVGSAYDTYNVAITSTARYVLLEIEIRPSLVNVNNVESEGQLLFLKSTAGQYLGLVAPSYQIPRVSQFATTEGIKKVQISSTSTIPAGTTITIYGGKR